MKIISSLVLGLLLIAPGLQASEAVSTEMCKPKTDKEVKEQTADTELAATLAKQLITAVEERDVQKVQELLIAKADANTRIPNSRKSPILHELHESSCFVDLDDYENKKQAIISLLFDYGANVNAKDALGETLLRCISNPDDLQLAILLERGANPNICDRKKTTIFDDIRKQIEKSRHDVTSDTFLHKINLYVQQSCCNRILILDAHRKKLDATTAAIRSVNQFPYVGKNTTDRIVVEYMYGVSRPDDKKLDALLKDFAELINQLRASGELS